MNIHRQPKEINYDEYLDELVNKSKSGIIAKTEWITPAFARVLLERNPDNRSLSQHYVDEYSRDIVNGNWEVNGETIVVANDGSLNNGQHRCHAIIAADTAVETILVVGPKRNTRLTVDQGKTRSGGDYLGMLGHANGNVLASVAGYIWQYDNKDRFLSQSKAQRPTRSDILNVVKNTKGIEESIAKVSGKGCGLVGGMSILGFCHFVIRRRSGTDEVDGFMASLMSGSNLPEKDPILYARNRLIQMRGSLRPNEKAGLIMKAWNAHRRGESIRNFQVNPNSQLPDLER